MSRPAFRAYLALHRDQQRARAAVACGALTQDEEARYVEQFQAHWDAMTDGERAEIERQVRPARQPAQVDALLALGAALDNALVRAEGPLPEAEHEAFRSQMQPLWQTLGDDDREAVEQRAVATCPRAQTSGWWYLSFADEASFRGAIVVQADDFLPAVFAASAHGIRPEGEVMGVALAYWDLPPPADRLRLLSPEDLHRIWPDAITLALHEQEDAEQVPS